MTDRTGSRRDFLKAAAAGAVGLALPTPAAGVHPAQPTRTAATIKLGVATYSLREMSRADAIAAIQSLDVRYVNVKSVHLPYESLPAEPAADRKAFEDAGLTIDGGGVIYLQQDDDDDIRRYFEYAKAARLPLMVIGATPTTLPRIERFVHEYDIPVAIHNHGPEDKYFPAPHDALALIGDMDPRMGVCVDLGHTARTGADVVEELVKSGDRLFDVHAHDAASQCVVGEGAMPMDRIFQQLADMNYQGCVDLEYEINPEDPLPGMRLSFAYMRGMLYGLRIGEEVGP